MGCDIHGVLEVKWNDKWIGLHNYPYSENANHYTMYRDYAFFAALAGVRGPGPEANGLPEDISDLTEFETGSWAGDGHSYGHKSLHDFAMCMIARDKNKVSLLAAEKLVGEDEEYWKLIEYCAGPAYVNDYNGVTVSDYRVVFWFDN